MKTEYQLASDQYVAEVEREAVKLIENGYAPWDARRIAGETVRNRRRRNSRRDA